MPTATTYLKSHKRADKRTALQSLKDRFDYGLNPEKLGAVSSYLCDPATAHAEFMLVKNQYQGETDRRAGHGALCYQIRQAFPHGEVTAEEANRIGYETAMRWTKGKYQFFVCTHIDKEHIHNHIYYNSTAYDRSRKFRNFIGSSFALRRLSDRVCLEHDLSVIVNPKLHSKGRYLHYGQWLGENQKLSQKEQIRLAIDTALTERPEDFADFLRRMETAGIQVKHGRGGVISFLVPGQQRAARFRAATLGDGYGPEDVQAVIDGKAPTRKAPARRTPMPRRVNLLIDIQERMRQGKGPAYERWAKVYNLKQMAAALQYLKEHQLFEYDDLAVKTDAATERFHTLAGDIQQTEAELSHVSDLMAAVVQYAKTRPAFDGYKAAKYSRKYLAEHEAELADYRAAKATMAELLGGEKLPKMDVLKEKRRQLAARKKALYLEYRKAQQDMRELVAVKGSVDHLRGLTDNQRNKEQARYEWVWYKSRCTGFLNARRAPLKKTENILVFYQKLPLYNPQFEQGKPYKKIAGNRGDSTNYGKFIRSGSGSEDGLRFPGNVLAFPTVQRTVHPTQKPVALSEYFIKTYTRPGEVVADICAGSGTTAVAALNTGRRFICFETVPAYYAAASERIRAARAAVEAGEKGV